MSTFQLIIKKIINTDNNIFSIHYDKSDRINIIIKSLFFYFISKEINIENKFAFFFEITQNTFYKNIVEDFINYFCKIQKTYYSFNKLTQIFKYKKTNSVVDFDIGLNKINETQPNVFSLVHHNSKYLFSIKDLINIINAALTNNYQFFVEPLCIKNPYNNIPFSKSTLYNIFFFILHNTCYRPDLFFKFFECDFNLSRFGKKYEVLLRECYIYNYAYKSTSDVLFKEVTKMIRSFNDYCVNNNLKNQISIDDDFPKDKLIRIMKPYLLMHLTSLYSMNQNKKHESSITFKYMMTRFNNFNPQFGRKKYKILFKYNANFKKTIAGKIIEFDDKHVTFNDNANKSENFLSDHLTYKENYISYFTNFFVINENQDYSQGEETDTIIEEEQEDEEYEEYEEEEEAEDDEEEEEEAEDDEEEYEEEAVSIS